MRWEVSKIDCKKLNRLLVESFPNLIDKYNEEIEWQEGEETGSHTVYGDVLTPYFTECIRNNREAEVIKILNFFEKILALNNKYSNEVIAFSVLEQIECEYGKYSILKNNYGKLTRKMMDEIQNYR